MAKVICKSGLEGWQNRLQENYSSFEEFKAWADCWGIHTRLGYKTIRGAWKANPMVQGSVIPSDFRKVKVK